MIAALPYSKLVEKHILDCIQGGIGIRQMIASMQHLQDAPKSLSTMYKIYGSFIEMERAKINGAVGKKVIDLFEKLRRKGEEESGKKSSRAGYGKAEGRQGRFMEPQGPQSAMQQPVLLLS